MRLVLTIGLIACCGSACLACSETPPTQDPIGRIDGGADENWDHDELQGSPMEAPDAYFTVAPPGAGIEPCEPTTIEAARFAVEIDPDDGFDLAGARLHLAALWFQVDEEDPDPAPVALPVVEVGEDPELPLEEPPADPLFICDRAGCADERSCPCQAGPKLAMGFVVLFDDANRDGALDDGELVGMAEREMVIWLSQPRGEATPEVDGGLAGEPEAGLDGHLSRWLGSTCLEAGFHLMIVNPYPQRFDSLVRSPDGVIHVRATPSPDLLDVPNLG